MDVAALEQRLRQVEGKVEAAPKPEAQPDLGAKLTSLQGDLESRTKANAEADQALGEKLAALQEVAEGPVMMMSGATKDGVTEVLRALRAVINGARAEERREQEEVKPWQP